MAFSSDRRHIEIWSCDPRRCVFTASDRGMLSAQERDAMTSFRSQDAHRQYLASRVMLRQILSRYEPHVAPAAWRFENNGCGKPRVSNAMSAPLYFNISHISACVVIAVSRGGEVGVDIETCAKLPDPQPLIALCFSDAEKRHLTGLASAERRQAFIRRWTLKEAWLKALGKGLSVPPASVECTWQADRWQIDDHHHRLTSRRGWSIDQRALSEDIQLAVVAAYPGASMDLIPWLPSCKGDER